MSTRFHTTTLCVFECETKTCGLRFHSTSYEDLSMQSRAWLGYASSRRVLLHTLHCFLQTLINIMAVAHPIHATACTHVPCGLINYRHLLTQMDRATLLHAKSTLSHCPLSIFRPTRQRASVDSKLLYRPRNVQREKEWEVYSHRSRQLASAHSR